jgi:hypothetical protein
MYIYNSQCLVEATYSPPPTVTLDDHQRKLMLIYVKPIALLLLFNLFHKLICKKKKKNNCLPRKDSSNRYIAKPGGLDMLLKIVKDIKGSLQLKH